MKIIQHIASFTKNEEIQVIQSPDEVTAMMVLASLGWGSKRIAKELGCARNTVKRYLQQGGWQPYQAPNREPKLRGYEKWLEAAFKQHNGNADVVRQELKSKFGIEVSLRTVERAVAHLRCELRKENLATVRFETLPGQQLQVDFGSKLVPIGGEKTKVYVFAATLAYSRRLYVEVFTHERQTAWLQGIEGALRHFGGATEEILVDNAASLVKTHNRQTGELVFNERFLAFCRYWGLKPRACAPYRARTKGKDERGVGYTKNNALAGREFGSWEAMAEHLSCWTREVADVRIHGTTGEAPAVRFARDELAVLRELGGRGSFQQFREFARIVAKDAFVDLDTNHYSVPWRLIGESVTVTVSDQTVRISYAGNEVAVHGLHTGRHAFVRNPEHFKGIFKRNGSAVQLDLEQPRAELARPLSEYEAVAGGGW